MSAPSVLGLYRIGTRFGAQVSLAACGAAALMAITFQALAELDATVGRLARLGQAQQHELEAASAVARLHLAAHRLLQARADAAAAVPGADPGVHEAEVAGLLTLYAAARHGAHAALADPALAATIPHAPDAELHRSVEVVLATPVATPEDAGTLLAAHGPAFDAALRDSEGAAASMRAQVRAAQDEAHRLLGRARNLLVYGTAAILVFCTAFACWIVRSITRPLRQLEAAAREIQAGRHARVRSTDRSELGHVAAAFDAMADATDAALAEAQRASDDALFQNRLDRALESTDVDAGVHRVLGRATTEMFPDTPVALLLADSSEAHVRVVATNRAGDPRCSVSCPAACPAVRQARVLDWPSSETFDACPNLGGTDDAPVTATCAPVTFLGRALGVLHAARPADRPFGPEEQARLAVIAREAAHRLGTMRVLDTARLQATSDPLTGLLNRRALEEKVRLLGAQVRYTVVMGDLDHFKRVNDVYGHGAGDQCIRRFAELLRAGSRADDLICRYGGEEFVLVLVGLDAEAARPVVERLRAATEASPPLGNAPPVTASFGLADSAAAGSFEQAVRLADAALYRAKREGRNRVVVATPDGPALELLPGAATPA